MSGICDRLPAASRALCVLTVLDPWGSAALHPRLHAAGRFADSVSSNNDLDLFFCYRLPSK